MMMTMTTQYMRMVFLKPIDHDMEHLHMHTKIKELLKRIEYQIQILIVVF